MYMTFIEIEKINSFGEVGKILVRVADIVGIKQMHVESKKLYDIDGNVVSEEPATDKDFQVLVVSNQGKGYVEQVHVNESEYVRLVQVLTTNE